MDARPYQQRAIDQVRQLLGGGAGRVCLVAPTGSGKTVMGATIASGAVAGEKRVLWLVHRTELCDQAAGTLERLGLTVGVVSASSSRAPNPYASVQVASLQTLHKRRESLPDADLVIFDEAHHAAADTYASLLSEWPYAQRLGMTATPERADGRGLHEHFDRIVVAASVRELVQQAVLVPVDVVVPTHALNPGEIAQSPAAAYQKHAHGRSALVFSPTVATAEQHLREFHSAGVTARLVEAATPVAERAEAIQAFRTGQTKVLVNVEVLTEGFDAPIASAAILARGVGSAGMYLQIAGRIMRSHHQKSDAVLIDLRGSSYAHGHPLDDRTFSLTGRGIRSARLLPDQSPSDPQAIGDGDLQVTDTPLIRFAPAVPLNVASNSADGEASAARQGKRRTRGHGSILCRGGSFCIRWYDANGKRRFASFPSKAHAEEALRMVTSSAASIEVARLATVGSTEDLSPGSMRRAIREAVAAATKPLESELRESKREIDRLRRLLEKKELASSAPEAKSVCSPADDRMTSRQRYCLGKVIQGEGMKRGGPLGPSLRSLEIRGLVSKTQDGRFMATPAGITAWEGARTGLPQSGGGTQDPCVIHPRPPHHA